MIWNLPSLRTLGFAIMAIAMAYSAVVQNAIYQAGPCYSRPLAILRFCKNGYSCF
jgi:hypothetical protein